MSKLRIVPEKDWVVLKEYLDEHAAILIPQHVLEELPAEKQEKLQEIADFGGADNYDFGGEPDIVIDTILSKDAYALGIILGEDNTEEDDE